MKKEHVESTESVSREHLRLWGFTEAEAYTFLALLKTDPAGVSDIAQASGVPRTTVHAALKRLSARGLVRKLPHSYKSVWKVKNLEKIKSAAAETFKYLEKENAEEIPGKKEIVGRVDAEDIGIQVFKGAGQMKRAYEEILKLRRAERVYFIQGNESAKTVFEKIEKEYFYTFHKRLKQRGIIMEGLAGEATLDIFKNMEAPFLKSHFGRLLIGRVVPDEFMNFNLDIFVMRGKVFFVSLEQEIVIMIRFQPVVDALLKICEAFSALGRKFDLNAYLRELIEKRVHEDSE